MKHDNKLLGVFAATLFVGPILFSPLLASAGGGGHVPLGMYSDPMVGISPPPGFYFTEYLSYYSANKLKDNSGRTLSLSRDGTRLDRSSAYASGNRILWMSKFKILGGFYGAQFVVPVERLNTMIDVLTPVGPMRMGEGRGGVGDLFFNPFILAWHEKHGLFHITTGVDITAPTGPYGKYHMVNVGKHLWTIIPAFQITVFVPWYPKIAIGARLDYSFNTKNNDFIVNADTAAKIGNMALSGVKTSITPGQEFHLDYGISYALLPLRADPQLSVGVVGYYYQQITDDKTGVGTVEHDKGRVFAVGPGVWFNYKKWNIGLRAAFETVAKNRPEGFLILSTITYTF
jgi:hypothetical protein